MTVDLKIAMLKAGLSQAELASKLGIHPSSLSRFINGWLIPPPEVEEGIRKALGEHGRRVRFGRREKDSTRS